MKLGSNVGLAVGVVVFLASLLTFINAQSESEKSPGAAAPTGGDAHYAHAIFAGGCFWCMEPPYDKVDGVIATISGYTDGHKENPTYKQVSSGTTGHTEAIKITYDPAKVSYQELLKIFWRNIDPVTPNRQFCDGGTQYRSGIYYLNDEQKQLAEQSKSDIEASGILKQAIVTEIKSAKAKEKLCCRKKDRKEKKSCPNGILLVRYAPIHIN